MHHNCHVIIHVLTDIPQEASRNNTHSPECDAGQVDILVTLRVRNLTRRNYNRIRSLILPDSRNQLQILKETRTRQGDRLSDIRLVLDPEFEHHRATNVVRSHGDELVEEDVVVDAVADGTANDADGEGESGDGGDEVIWANDGCDDGGGNDDAADSETCENKEAPELIEVVNATNSEGSAAWTVY